MNIEKHLKRVKKITKAHAKVQDKANVFYSFYKEVITKRWPIESLLNIGVGPGGQSNRWLGFLHKVFPTIRFFENLECDGKIVNKWRKANNPYLKNITHGDVRKIDEYYVEDSFDLIFWNQGPEHIHREEWKECFEKLERITSKALWLHCPWGSGYDKDKFHYSKSIRRGEFEPFGFTVMYIGKENTKHAGVASWKLL